MSEQEDPKEKGSEQDFSEFAKRSRSQPPAEDGGGSGGSFMRGCGIALGVVVLIFFFIFGACFINFR